ncbi:hypothetical protein J6590_107079, partial [Homalodisca vitripennis]
MKSTTGRYILGLTRHCREYFTTLTTTTIKMDGPEIVRCCLHHLSSENVKYYMQVRSRAHETLQIILHHINYYYDKDGWVRNGPLLLTLFIIRECKMLQRILHHINYHYDKNGWDSNGPLLLTSFIIRECKVLQRILHHINYHYEKMTGPAMVSCCLHHLSSENVKYYRLLHHINYYYDKDRWASNGPLLLTHLSSENEKYY